MKRPAPRLQLNDGDRIAVIGSGPAGTFFSYLAQDLAKQRGKTITITLFDGKDFLLTGPPGCNMCAGVLSESLTEKLFRAGLQPPEDRVQVEIEKYLLSADHYNISLFKRRRRFPIYTVYRGNGPRDRISRNNISFDDFLLDRCRGAGVEIIPQMVRDIRLPNVPAGRVTLICGDESRCYEFDLVVIACGLNTQFLQLLTRLGFGYQPPRMVHTVQAEIPVSEEFIRRKIGHSITTFTLDEGNIRFAAFTPKKQHLTLSIVGKKDVGIKDLEAVLLHPRIQEFLEGSIGRTHLCVCRPRIAVSAAKNVFTDRLVVIGDAAFSRYYKNGIESAFDTAQSAAFCVFESGISAEDFRQCYLNRTVRRIRSSSRSGRVIFRIYDIVFHNRILSAGLVSLLARRRRTASSRRIVRILWNLFTGNADYSAILLKLFNPRIQLRLTSELLRAVLRKIMLGKGVISNGNTVCREVDAMGPLGSGQIVGIIGGGPAGVGCALALKKIAADRGITLHIVLYEGKDFDTQPHYNQCVGVLSPPIVQILQEELGIPFPYHLVQRIITGYVLHSDDQELALPGDEEPSVAVRRVTFDSYMLNMAKKRGVEIVKSRVTDLEFDEDSVMIYSETDNRRVDVVVGAFGLDAGTAGIFEKMTPYRQPRYLDSIVTKIHPGEEIVARFENNIHAFLPRLREIEFGAVTPKKNHLTINVAGAEVTAQSLKRFLEMPAVRRVLPATERWNPGDLSYFKGRFPIAVARGFYGDRYVIIGDAAGLLRPFKGKGVNTAILTGMRVARTMFDEGIHRKAFGTFTAKCKDITNDLPYGKFVRFAALRISNWGLLNPILAVARQNDRLRRALFNSVSAHQTYRAIMGEFRNTRLLLKIAKSIILYPFRRPLAPEENTDETRRNQ
jgi:flavin-dependent dehydrogenase